MTDMQEKKANGSQDSRTINIEIPSGCFEGMFRMMGGFNSTNKRRTGCCDMPQDNRCPHPEVYEGQEFNIVIKMKE